MSRRWDKQTPDEEGWYWIEYQGKHGLVACPCRVTRLRDTTVVYTARNVTFIEGPGHGGPGLRCDGVLDPTVRFGPAIEEPE
jgi:hypothetical protein